MVIRVQTRDNEPVDKSLRRLRKLCNNEGITRTAKAKNYFEKPSERRRREKRERVKAIRLSTRAKRQELDKLLDRRRKARKNARLAAIRAESENSSGDEENSSGDEVDVVVSEEGGSETAPSGVAPVPGDVGSSEGANKESQPEEPQPGIGGDVIPEAITPSSEGESVENDHSVPKDA